VQERATAGRGIAAARGRHLGSFKNSGRELRPKREPEKVRVHDFVIPELGRATPYGVYDLAPNTGWVCSQNWRGKPLLSFEVIVNLIAATTTAKGLTAAIGSSSHRAIG
jgi:hypothetical protein